MKRNTYQSIVAALALVACAALLAGYNYQPADTLESAWSTAADASTDCMASETDASGSTDATADLTCLNTGSIAVQGWQQATVHYSWTRSAGTVVLMQCDTSVDSGVTWAPVPRTDSESVQAIRTWTYTTSVSGAMQANFEINASHFRCRWTITTGNSGDTLSYRVRKASIVAR